MSLALQEQLGSKACVINAITQREKLIILHALINMPNISHDDLKTISDKVKASSQHNSYAAIAMCTGHLTEEDKLALSHAINEGSNQVLERETGYFIKIELTQVPRAYSFAKSDNFKMILQWAHASGYQLIEFDTDADAMSQFEYFE
jgi:hypothetical protein